MHSKRQFDHLTLCSPSGALINPQQLDQAITVLQTYCLPIVEQNNVRSRFQRFAGTDSERIQAIEMACCLRQSSLILATRGGYGMSRLLPQLHLEKLVQSLNHYQHVLCGHSDITALQLALLSAGAQPETLLHGPMACFDFGDSLGIHPDTEHWFSQAVFNNTVHIQWQAPVFNPQSSLGETSNELLNSIVGPAWGGNLTMLTSLLGTPWLPNIRGGILILEDVNESAYKIERMLLQLVYAGVLTSQQVVLMGNFSEPSPHPHDHGYCLSEVFRYLNKQHNVRILTHFPFGHVQPKSCWFQGCPAELTIQAVSDDLLNCTLRQCIQC